MRAPKKGARIIDEKKGEGKMTEQIKHTLQKLLIASAIAVSYSGFSILADGEQPHTLAENVPE